MKTEILYGIHPVSEALKAGRRKFFEVYLAQHKGSKRAEKAATIAKSLNIPLKKVKTFELSSITGTDEHQGIGARVSPYPLAEPTDIFDNIKVNENPFLLLLDSIVDPHNLGALIRTALCVGIEGVLIPKDRSASPTPAVSSASAGALEHIRLGLVTNMVSAIKALKKKGLWIAGMDKSAQKSIFSFDFSCPLAIVIGGEEKGIRTLVKKHCDFLISIPQKGEIDSLNASAAGAVVMYEAFRQRQKSEVRGQRSKPLNL